VRAKPRQKNDVSGAEAASAELEGLQAVLEFRTIDVDAAVKLWAPPIRRGELVLDPPRWPGHQFGATDCRTDLDCQLPSST
jgi:hypothetical protein